MDKSHFYWKKAQELKANGHIEKAIAAYQDAIAANPSFSWYYYHLGEAMVSVGHLHEAAHNYQKAAELNPNFAWFHQDLADVMAKLGNLNEAINCIQKAIELNPDISRFYNCLGELLNQQGKRDEAIAYWQKAIEVNPNSAKAYYNMGEAYRGQKKWTEAEGFYCQAIQINPYSISRFHYSLGNVLMEQGKLDEAVKAFEKAIEIEPNICGYYHRLGLVFQRKNMLEEAIKVFRKAVEIDRKFWHSHNELANSLKALGRVDEAEDSYRQVIQLNPNNFYSHKILGDILEEKGQVEAAIECLSRAIEIKPKLAAELQLFDKLKGQLELAIVAARKALTKNPQDFYAYKNLGELLEKAGDLDEALTIYSKTVELESNLAPHGYIDQGRVLEKQKKIDEAITSYQKFIELKHAEDNAYIAENLPKRNLNLETNQQQSSSSKIKRLIIVGAPTWLLNVLSILRFQEATGEYQNQECEDYLAMLSQGFRLRQTMEVGQIWNFHRAMSVQGLATIIKNCVSYSTALELMKKEFGVEFDVVYVHINNYTVFKQSLEVYSNARKIVYGDSLGQLCLEGSTPVDEAYLITPYERTPNAFGQCQVKCVEPSFYGSVIHESSKNITGLYEYCQEIKERLGDVITVCPTKYYAETNWAANKDLEVEIQMYMSHFLEYTKPGESVLIKGHPGGVSQNRATIVAERLRQAGRNAMEVHKDLEIVSIDLFTAFLNINKCINFTSSSCVSLAYLTHCEIILGFGEKILNEYFVPGIRDYIRGSERVYYSQIQQAYRGKFELISRFVEMEKPVTDFPQFPFHMKYQDFVN